MCVPSSGQSETPVVVKFAFQLSKRLQCCLGSDAHTHSSEASRSSDSILRDSSPELPPLCDCPNTFRFPGAPFHGPSARAWGFSFLAQLRTFSNCVSVWCQVVGGQREEESSRNSPHTPGTTVPLIRERDSPTCTVLDGCPAPPDAASAGLTAGWTGENEKRGKTHSEHRSPFSWSSGRKVRTLILKIFCAYQCVLLGSGLPLCHVILERGTQETHDQFGGTSNSHLLPQAALLPCTFQSPKSCSTSSVQGSCYSQWESQGGGYLSHPAQKWTLLCVVITFHCLNNDNK